MIIRLTCWSNRFCRRCSHQLWSTWPCPGPPLLRIRSQAVADSGRTWDRSRASVYRLQPDNTARLSRICIRNRTEACSSFRQMSLWKRSNQFQTLWAYRTYIREKYKNFWRVKQFLLLAQILWDHAWKYTLTNNGYTRHTYEINVIPRNIHGLQIHFMLYIFHLYTIAVLSYLRMS